MDDSNEGRKLQESTIGNVKKILLRIVMAYHRITEETLQVVRRKKTFRHKHRKM